jgi:hypothetical protein
MKRVFKVLGCFSILFFLGIVLLAWSVPKAALKITDPASGTIVKFYANEKGSLVSILEIHQDWSVVRYTLETHEHTPIWKLWSIYFEDQMKTRLQAKH